MITERSLKSSCLAALSLAALALAGCSSGTPEAAVKDTSTAKLLTGDAFLTGLGLQSSGKERPDNSPRAQLVIPPGRNLPRPQEEAALATANAAWPNDPDIARATRRAELQRRAEENGVDDFERQKYILQTKRTLATAPMKVNRRDHSNRVTARSHERDIDNAIKDLKRGSRVARAIRARQAESAGARRTLLSPPAEYAQLPENAPPPPEKKKRRWWPF